MLPLKNSQDSASLRTSTEFVAALNQTLLQPDEWERMKNIVTPEDYTLQQVPFDHTMPSFLTGASVRTDVLKKECCGSPLVTMHHWICPGEPMQPDIQQSIADLIKIFVEQEVHLFLFILGAEIKIMKEK